MARFFKSSKEKRNIQIPRITAKITTARTDTTMPYTFEWKRDRIRLFHIFVIKVIAYDRMIVRKFL